MGPDDPVIDNVTQQAIGSILVRLASRARDRANARMARGDPVGDVEEEYNTYLIKIDACARAFGIIVRSEHREN